MFAEAIDVILGSGSAIRPTTSNFDNRYKVSTGRTMTLDLGVGIMGKPYQQPRRRSSAHGGAVLGVVLMGSATSIRCRRTFCCPVIEIALAELRQSKAEVGEDAKVADWRVARALFVADDDKVAASYGRYDEKSPYRFYYEQMRRKMIRGKRLTSSRPRRTSRTGDHPRLGDGSLRDPWRHQQGGRSDYSPCEEIGDFGGLCRNGLGGSRAQQAFHAIDGRGGHAAGECGDRQVGRRSVGCACKSKSPSLRHRAPGSAR
jgi:hypothetical protein